MDGDAPTAKSGDSRRRFLQFSSAARSRRWVFGTPNWGSLGAGGFEGSRLRWLSPPPVGEVFAEEFPPLPPKREDEAVSLTPKMDNAAVPATVVAGNLVKSTFPKKDGLQYLWSGNRANAAAEYEVEVEQFKFCPSESDSDSVTIVSDEAEVEQFKSSPSESDSDSSTIASEGSDFPDFVVGKAILCLPCYEEKKKIFRRVYADLGRHRQNCHKNYDIVCVDCNNGFKNEAFLTDHRRYCKKKLSGKL